MSVHVQTPHNAPAFEHRHYKHDLKAADEQVQVYEKECPDDEARRPSLQSWSVPPSAWQPLRHPHCEQVSREVNTYFISEWNFPNEKAERRFLAADFPGATCLYFPLAKDDRIHFACTLLTVLFLIDGEKLPGVKRSHQKRNMTKVSKIYSKTCPSKTGRPTTRSSFP